MTVREVLLQYAKGLDEIMSKPGSYYLPNSTWHNFNTQIVEAIFDKGYLCNYVKPSIAHLAGVEYDPILLWSHYAEYVCENMKAIGDEITEFTNNIESSMLDAQKCIRDATPRGIIFKLFDVQDTKLEWKTDWEEKRRKFKPLFRTLERDVYVEVLELLIMGVYKGLRPCDFVLVVTTKVNCAVRSGNYSACFSAVV